MAKREGDIQLRRRLLAVEKLGSAATLLLDALALTVFDAAHSQGEGR